MLSLSALYFWYWPMMSSLATAGEEKLEPSASGQPDRWEPPVTPAEGRRTKSDDLTNKNESYVSKRRPQRSAEREQRATYGVGCDPKEMSCGTLVETHEALGLGCLPDTVDRVLVQQSTHAAVRESLGRL